MPPVRRTNLRRTHPSLILELLCFRQVCTQKGGAFPGTVNVHMHTPVPGIRRPFNAHLIVDQVHVHILHAQRFRKLRNAIVPLVVPVGCTGGTDEHQLCVVFRQYS